MSFFLPYQKKWLLDNSRIKLMEKSRQIGMSWTSAYSLVRRHAISSQRLDSWVSSRDEVQASLFVQDCKKFAEILNIAFTESVGVGVSKSASSCEIEFVNSTKIHSLSSNPDAQAGKRGNRILDEFALHEDPEKLYAIAYPGITWGGQLEIISTHRGADSFFNKLVCEIKYNNNPKNISLHTVSLQDALEQGFLQKLKNALGKDNPVYDMDEAEYFNYIKSSCVDEQSFMQEYMCIPANDNEVFVPFAVLQKNFYPPSENWRCEPSTINNPMYLGVDVARTRDFSAFCLIEKINGHCFVRDIQLMKDAPFSEQESVLFSYLRHENVIKACIDNTGIGRQFAERAKERYGNSRIKEFNFSAKSKEILAYPLKSALENCEFSIPDIEAVRTNFRNLKRSFAYGGTSFSAQHNSDGHCDLFWALALAFNASRDFGTGQIKILPSGAKERFIW